MQPQPLFSGALAQEAVASQKDVLVELTPYSPEGTPWQGHEGLAHTGTEDRIQATSASNQVLVRPRKLGLEAGEPVVCLPRDGRSLGPGREHLTGRPRSGSTAHCMVFLQPVVYVPPL